MQHQGPDHQPDPQALEPAEAAETQDQEDEAKARPRNGVREALEPLQRPGDLRGHRPVGPTNYFDDSRGHRLGEACRDGRPWPPRGPESWQHRHHRSHLAIHSSRAVSKNLARNVAGGTKA
jgi:hypothetical protein